jgi:hypothetical protein
LGSPKLTASMRPIKHFVLLSILALGPTALVQAQGVRGGFREVERRIAEHPTIDRAQEERIRAALGEPSRSGRYTWREDFERGLARERDRLELRSKTIAELGSDASGRPSLYRVIGPGTGVRTGGPKLRSTGRLGVPLRKFVDRGKDYVELNMATTRDAKTALVTVSGESRNIRTAGQLKDLVREFPAQTFVLRGDPLPRSWARVLAHAGSRVVYWSKFSAKKTAPEVQSAIKHLDRSLEPPKVQILDALPQSEDLEALRQELRAMVLEPSEADAWRDVSRQVKGVSSSAGAQRRVATADNITAAFEKSDNDIVILIAHQSDGKIHLPQGSVLLPEAIKQMRPGEPRRRLTILLSCDAGRTAGLGSTAELIVGNSTSELVVAPAAPLSALLVPLMLDDLLVKKLPVYKVVQKYDLRPIATGTKRTGGLKKTQLAAGAIESDLLPPN